MDLLAACKSNNINEARELLSKGVDANFVDPSLVDPYNDRTTPPLHYAVQNRNIDLILLLFKHGATPINISRFIVNI